GSWSRARRGRGPVAPGGPGWAGASAAAGGTGSARANAWAASNGLPIRSTGSVTPRRAAASCSTPAPPATRNGGSRSASRRIHAWQINSGPTPAGSPSDTASGAGIGSVIFDHRVAAEVAQVALPALVDAVVLDLGHQRVAVRPGVGRRVVAAAQHEDPHTLLERAERPVVLAHVELEQRSLQPFGQRPHGDVVGHDLRA